VIYEDEDESSQVDPAASQDYDETWGFYGVLPTKIVGVRYYSGYANPGELVLLRREPHNQYDANAIQVLNMHNEQIGHVPRAQAAKLARYMDNRLLLLETSITGPKGQFECPIDIRLYGTDDPVAREDLIAQLRADRLPVGHAMDRKRKQQKAAKAAAKTMLKGGGGGGSGGVVTLEDIVEGSELINPRNIGQVVEKFGTTEKSLAAMPQAKQPDALSTEMHAFQLQGLQWMLDRESPTLPAQGTKDVVQLWQRHPNYPGAFSNLATGFATTKPKLASGGILADDMGLGKTIQVISLIMADRALGRRAPDACDATLILTPVSVMSNWSTQILKHVKEEYGLRVMFYHGTRKEPINRKQIANYDVVISTYDSVSIEWHSQKSTALPRKSGIFSVKWRRVVLDEGHCIRNPKAKRTVAIFNLLAQSRWVLTGTPIINNLKDLFSLVCFLGLSGGLSEWTNFRAAIIRPVQQGDAQGNAVLQLLMSGICLRRKKEMSFIDLRLPELSEYVHKVKLLPHEQEKYDALEAQAKGTLDLYRRNVRSHDRQASVTYRHLLEVLLRMRQLCNHWKLIHDERLAPLLKQLEAEAVVDLTEENKQALQNMLQLSIESQEDCPICLDTLNDPVITRCAHIFCNACIERVIETQHKCPMCRVELESLQSTTVKPAKEVAAAVPLTQEQIKDKESLEKEASSKVEALLTILRASATDPTNKTIIFSQWTSFLDLLQPHLQGAGFKYTRIDGSLPVAERDAALKALDNDPSITIMLASLSVCSVGLNLVAANQVVMADSWWAPAIEDQAVDRVHRLGQKRKTKVFRLVVEGSIEDRVIGIQNDKRKLMSLAFAEKDGKKRRTVGAGLADLERLLG
jgi:SWI/SNF-related matrix-associated actin-dependent regulator of chromatin subfamily A3